ncbi:MAG: hypothetical protein Q8O83_02190 [bacterium]|nr:hypothetical protein [bacterium]
MDTDNLDLDFSDFVTGYLECALWSSTEGSEDGDMGASLEDNYGIEDIDPKTLKEMIKECEDFQKYAKVELAQYYKEYDESRAGHDFWLTRNGHGVGFWDRGLGELGDKLSEKSKPFGSYDLYAFEGKVYGQ